MDDGASPSAALPTVDRMTSETPAPPHPAAPAADGLVRDDLGPCDGDAVLVVAVRGGPDAWRRTSAYVTRAGGGTGRASWLAFYSDRQVYAPVARVLGVVERVPRSVVEADRRRATGSALDRQVAAALDDALVRGGPAGDAVDVVLLSDPGDPRTQDCGGVAHDRPLGWCRSRRYTSWGALRDAGTTSGLAVPATTPPS